MGGGRIRYGYGYPLKSGGFAISTELIDDYVAYIQRADADGATVFPFVPCLFYRYAEIIRPSIDTPTAIYDGYNVRATLDGAAALVPTTYACKKHKFINIYNS